MDIVLGSNSSGAIEVLYTLLFVIYSCFFNQALEANDNYTVKNRRKRRSINDGDNGEDYLKDNDEELVVIDGEIRVEDNIEDNDEDNDKDNDEELVVIDGEISVEDSSHATPIRPD